ncbi:dihydrodipicolinate synthase family protein [Cohnella faecalis]|uniref:Dihydrodipicolinate synthase family protein n=1 Tax=Cohnella faecalis TaxID=2315694 RepID=A0A398CRB2_9BACL|nr:dihydrodipicolinate synthase family protein [Cohnella faecalis]RIE05083.1 dihydrodipicolinate synthase family protein [Cohnella faecalis]RIE05298.1 dihydrodipicolinate synthase family protein [Cohnella faecalis]
MKGNIPVIPTPFVDGKIDYEGFENLIRHTSDFVEGYVIGGSTGESPALSAEERIEIARFFAKRVPHMHIVIGLNHTNLEEAVAIGRAAVEAGIRSALVPSPYYFPNSLESVKAYVRSLAERTGLQIVFYDNPVTTKTVYTAQQLIELAAAVPAIKAIKMTDHNMGKIRALKQQTSLAVFGGDDIICFRAFEAGVDGNMIIAPIIYPKEFKECWDLYRAGKRQESFAVFSDKILPFIHMFGPGDEIPTTKALYKQLGLFKSAETRLPLLPSDEQRVSETLLGYPV